MTRLVQAVEEFWIGWVENAALSFRIDPSETVVRRADGGASGRMGGAVEME